MKVSIVLPVFNGEKFIKDSIESVLKQTFKDFELIIVNDCSTDSTPDIINSYAKKDSRIKIINNETNLKLPQSLNVGFKNAEGEYYTWTSDDNMYKENAIEYMVNFLDENKNTALVSLGFDVISSDGEFLYSMNNNGKNPKQLLYSNNIGACFMYRASVAKIVGKYNPDTFLAEDYDYWMRIASKGNVAYTDENLYIYRTHEKSLTATRKNEIIKVTKKVRYKNLYNLTKCLSKNFFHHISLMLQVAYNDLEYKPFYREKIKNKRIIHIFGIKFSYKKRKKIKIKKEIDYLSKYQIAKQWLKKYTVNNKGIAIESNQPNTIYPECTGYYIPTLLKFGDRKRAINFGNYLISIQNKDGSWSEPSGKVPYTFDTAQILKGLVALIENGLDENNKYKTALLKGCDWILTMQREDGSIATPDYSWWDLPFGKKVPEYIHVYCLEPLKKASELFNIEKYEKCVQKALKFYLQKEDLTDFMTLSHFNAYVIEGLIDLGEAERAKRAMDLISLHQRLDGSVSAYSFVDFVCSTGLLQYAICWYKLGEIEKADKAFNYVCKLQNKSGGFFGSYTVARDKANYFPEGEIDWAVKYFLDAIYFRQKAKYNNISRIFLDEIDSNDGRYLTIENELNNEKYVDVLDLGCGKARYTKKLTEKYKNKNFNCVDLSSKVLENVNLNVVKKEGSILNIPYSDNSFDFIYVTEALEHCIDLENAIKEISRVLKKNGKVVVIDKNIKAQGTLELADFEQWFNEKALCKIFEKNSIKTKVLSNIPYEAKKDNLFSAWVGEKK